MATNGFGGVPITIAVDDAQRCINNVNTPRNERYAAATLLVLLDMRRLLERIDDATHNADHTLLRMEQEAK